MMPNARIIYQILHQSPQSISVGHCIELWLLKFCLNTALDIMFSARIRKQASLLKRNTEKASLQRPLRQANAALVLLPIPATDKKKWPQRRGKVCSADERTKWVQKYCPVCKEQPGLCPNGHFQAYHC